MAAERCYYCHREMSDSDRLQSLLMLIQLAKLYAVDDPAGWVAQQRVDCVQCLEDNRLWHLPAAPGPD